MKLIIALSGWKKSGKDTAGDHIVDMFGFHRISLADALKHNTAVQYGIPLDFFHDQDLKEAPLKELPASHEAYLKYKDILAKEVIEDPMGEGLVNVYSLYYWTPRALLIHEGNMKRLVMPSYWVKAMATPIVAAEQAGQTLLVLTDLRYRDEIEAMRDYYTDYQIVTVRIQRFDTPPNKDSTERDLDNFDFDIKIQNRGTLEEFKVLLNHHIGNLINGLRTST